VKIFFKFHHFTPLPPPDYRIQETKDQFKKQQSSPNLRQHPPLPLLHLEKVNKINAWTAFEPNG
jgi:hypothetical protein